MPFCMQLSCHWFTTMLWLHHFTRSSYLKWAPLFLWVYVWHFKVHMCRLFTFQTLLNQFLIRQGCVYSPSVDLAASSGHESFDLDCHAHIFLDSWSNNRWLLLRRSACLWNRNILVFWNVLWPSYHCAHRCGRVLLPVILPSNQRDALSGEWTRGMIFKFCAFIISLNWQPI